MGKRILLVDDEPLIRKGLKYMLESEGYETDSAVDGEEALAKFTSGSFDMGAERLGIGYTSAHAISAGGEVDNSENY